MFVSPQEGPDHGSSSAAYIIIPDADHSKLRGKDSHTFNSFWSEVVYDIPLHESHVLKTWVDEGQYGTIPTTKKLRISTFLVLYMVLGAPFLYLVLIMTHETIQAPYGTVPH